MQMCFSFGAWGRWEDKEPFLPQKIHHLCSFQGPWLPCSPPRRGLWAPRRAEARGNRGLIKLLGTEAGAAT